MLTDKALKTSTARLQLPVRPKPYAGPSLGRGVQLLYRRNDGVGAWVVKAADGHGKYWTKRIAHADDLEAANGTTVLTLHDAKAKALELARLGQNGAEQREAGAPMTVLDALKAYERDLTGRGGRVENAQRLYKLLPSTLATRPVASLTGGDLRTWRDSLVAKGMSSGTVNRTRNGLRAALRLAAGLDPRIQNMQAVTVGLKGLAGGNRARDILLVEPGAIMRIVDEAFAEGNDIGLMVQVLAETGTRISQAADLQCHHLHIGAPSWLEMPSSYKGAGKNGHRHHEPVVISDELAARLQAARQGRADDAPLLTRNGERWQQQDTSVPMRLPFARAVERAGLDPARYTPYCLRHSHIVAQLRAGFPLLQVAKWHDTGIAPIQNHYAKYCNRDTDALQLAMAALPKRAIADNVVKLRA